MPSLSQNFTTSSHKTVFNVTKGDTEFKNSGNESLRIMDLSTNKEIVMLAPGESGIRSFDSKTGLYALSMVPGLNSKVEVSTAYKVRAKTAGASPSLDAAAQVGNIWQSDYPPTHPSMLMMGQDYLQSDNPILMLKQADNPSPNLILNDDGTFTVVEHTDFSRPTVDPLKIGVHVDDTTAANGLSVRTGFGFKGNTAANGGANRLTGSGSTYYSGTVTGDEETAPDHRGVYQGIWGDP